MGALAKLRALLARETPAQAAATREALRRAAAANVEAAVVGAAEQPIGGRIVMGTKREVMPSAIDTAAALRNKVRDAPVWDYHSHPADMSMFGVRPSPRDFNRWWAVYGEKPTDREIRTLIAMPPMRPTGAAYSFFATRDPREVFSPATVEKATYELKRAAAQGRFDSLKDDPMFADYFDNNEGDMADILEEVSPLLFFQQQAARGRGRHELEFGGRTITPHPEATERRAFELMHQPAMDVLRRFSRGGLAQVKERACA